MPLSDEGYRLVRERWADRTTGSAFAGRLGARVDAVLGASASGQAVTPTSRETP